MQLRFAVLAMILSSALPAAAAGIEERLAPTPLVLKDGRVARVSVHVIPFPIGRDRPDEAMQAQLAELVEALATDCFLTAQAVGHVEPGPGSDGDTLVAHRLARARADRVQAALTGRGLPASSIASVWDWQFAVREPRVTLWSFRLAEGDDCDNRPIVKAPLTAAAPLPAEPVTASAAPVVAPVVAAPVAAATPPQQPEPPAAPRTVDAPAPVAAEAVAAETTAAEAPGEPAPTPMEPAAVAQTGGETLVPLAAPEPEAVQAAKDDPTPAPEATAESELAITFDINSSYLPKGTSRELKALVGGMRGDTSYEIHLDGAVSSEHLRQQPTDKGLAYNRWLAERRMTRVADWLRQHVNGGAIDIRQDFVENDDSRRVMIRIRPLP